MTVQITPEIEQLIEERVQKALHDFENQLLKKVKAKVAEAYREQVIEQCREEAAGDIADARRAIISHNRLIADFTRLKKVPFVNNEDTPIYSLPPLVNNKSVYSLNEDEIDAYCKGYGLAREENLDMDRLNINEAIGAIAIRDVSERESLNGSAPSSPITRE